MPKIAITCGDPAGIGPEIIKEWSKHVNAEELKDCVIIGPISWLGTLEHVPESSKTSVGNQDFLATPGKPTEVGAEIALDAMEYAAEGCLNGSFNAVVTGPISKEWMKKAGFAFPGQTEFFASKWGGEPTMGFVGKKMRVTLATWHLPLKNVPETLSKEGLKRTLKHTAWLMRALGVDKPKIGVCGLNPHAGEAGILGREEIDWINPLLKVLSSEIPGISTTLPADTLFYKHLKGEFDCVVALYHDQGLAPLKTVEFDEAVNVTLGLPWIRTSPDHGTAFDIAGKDLASIGSFSRAVKVAKQLALQNKAP